MFKLSEQFIDEYKGKQPKWGELGYFVYKRTYSRSLQNGKSEEFWQTLQRVVEGVYTIQKRHCDSLKLPWNAHKAQKSAQEMYRRMWEFKFLPPGRGLWAFDLDLIDKKGSGPLNNCAFVSTDELSTSFTTPFTFAMDMLMLGVGVGFDTTGKNLVTISTPKTTTDIFVVEDTREGWVKLLEVVLDSFIKVNHFPLIIDYSKVRKEGEPIKTFGGTASGPIPLADLIMCIVEIFTNKRTGEFYLLNENNIQDFSKFNFEFESYKITSENIVDVFNLIGRCVVSGNVRRSSELAIGNKDDKEFKKLKQNKEKLIHHRWASNNSVSCEIGMDYLEFSGDTSINGEPGYIWLENARQYGRLKDGITDVDSKVKGFNPCGEQKLESMEMCCLVETFPVNHDTYEDFQRTLKYAYLYAKTVTLIPTHDSRTNAVMMRNRRIGTSMSGITSAFQRFGKRKFFNWCDSGYSYLKNLDKMYSDWLCIPKSICISTVKPSGTIPFLPGLPPGIHYPHSEYYIRNVRINHLSPLLQLYKDAGYQIEKDESVPNTLVISFPIHEKYFNRGKTDVSMWEQLETAAQMQYYWSDNSVSVTVTFSKSEAKDISKALELYETRLKSVSFLPLEDHGYKQAPYITITKEEYEKMISKIKPVKTKEDLHEITDKFCDGESCQI